DIDSDSGTVYNRRMDDNDTPPSGGDTATGYTMDELAELGQVPVRTVRFYIAQGVLPGPGSRGRAATYSDEHLLRLRLIRRLAERRVPLAEMRALLAPLTADETRALLAAEERHTVTLQEAARAPSPKEYIAALLSQAQAARQPGGSAGQDAFNAGRGLVASDQEAHLNGQPSIAQPPQTYVPRPLGPTPPARMPLHVPGSQSYSHQRTRSPASGSPPGKGGARSGAETTSAWHRWELAPGVELQVRAEALERSRALISRLLRAAGIVDHPAGPE
ncbi:MAG: MerR family transcriptional regulator, partial [Ktedonobacterales bacterium]